MERWKVEGDLMVMVGVVDLIIEIGIRVLNQFDQNAPLITKNIWNMVEYGVPSNLMTLDLI